MNDSALDQWLSHAEGISVRDSDREVFRCDFCDGAIHPNDRPSSFLSTYEILGRGDGAIMLQRHYCEYCNRKRIREPLAGTLELICSHRYTTDSTLVEWRVEHYSTPSQGIQWDPIELLDGLPDPFASSIYDMAAEYHTGSEDILDALITFDIDPRDLIDGDGAITITDADRGRMVQNAANTGDRTRREYTQRQRERVANARNGDQ